MEKNKLLNLRTLGATRTMMEKAYKDHPKKTRTPWGTEISYKYGIYLRMQMLGGIMKAAVFFADRMREGSALPAYEIFINPETGEFLTRDVPGRKWRTAKLDMLEWPSYFHRSGKWCSGETNRWIKVYLGTSKGGYDGILEYQKNIRADELEKKHRKETDPWDEDMAIIPELPKDWQRFVDKTGIRENYIFYEYKKNGAKEGYCTWCERNVPVKNPKYNAKGKCCRCGHDVVYKSVGMAGNFYTKDNVMYLLQKIKTGFVVREFTGRRHYRKPDYDKPEISCLEVRRVLYGTDGPIRTYYYGDYKNTGHRWIRTVNMEDAYWSYYHNEANGRVYRRTIPRLEKHELSRTGLSEVLKHTEEIDPESYLLMVSKKPYLEQIAKAGLGRLAYDLFTKKKSLKIKKNSSLAKAIGIDRQRMKRIRENNGGFCFLEWMKHEKRIDTIIDDKAVQFFDRHGILPKDLEFITDRMGYQKISNYLDRQYRISGRLPKELVSTWEDYLCMAGRLKINTGLEIFYKPKDLIRSHDEAVKLSGGGEIAKRAGEIAQKFPDVDEICQSIREKYEFGDSHYRIIVPERIEDIIMEGRVLGHCLDRSGRYFDRIQRRESYIVFLRRAEEPDTPYYTLEIEPDGTARQKRTTGDRQNKDFEEAVRFIRKWQQKIQKNLSEEDRRLAGESERQRIEEFIELRKSGAKIWHGILAGQMLADVLEEDLMEVKGNGKEYHAEG